MADAATNLPLRLTIREDGSAALDVVAKKLKAVNVSAKEMAAQAKQTNESLKTLAGGAKTLLGVFGVSVGSFAVIGYLKEAASKARDAEVSLAKLAQVVRATGGSAGYSAGELAKMGKALRDSTLFSGGEIRQAQTVLLAFRDISGQAFDETLRAALDLSTVMGQDLQSSIVQIGKAMQDPVVGMTALRRVGVSFTEQQQNMVKALVESGRKLEAQKLIVAELRLEFGGAAEAAGNTTTAGIKRLDDAFGDLKETIGEVITEGPRMRGVWEDVAGGVGWVTRLVKAAKPEVQGFFADVNDGLLSLAWAAKELQHYNLFGSAASRGAGGAAALDLRARIRTSAELAENERRAREETGGRFYSATASEALLLNRPWRRKPAPGPRGGGGEPAKPPQYRDFSLRGKYEEELASETAFASYQTTAGTAEIAVGSKLAGQAKDALRAEFEAWEAGQKEMAGQKAQARQAELAGNAELAARVIELDRATFAAQEEAQRARALQEEDDRQARLAGVREINARILNDEKAQHESLMGLVRERARQERESIQARNAAVVAGVQLVGQAAGQASGLFRQLYEDSGGQAKRYWEYYKAMSIGETTIATAQGIMNVWAGPLGKYPPAAAAMSAVVGALGAVQVGLISRQQPAKSFGEGGLVTRRVDNATLGEAGPEAVIPLRRVPEILGRSGGAAAGGGGNVQVSIRLGDINGIDAGVVAALESRVRALTEAGVRAALAGPQGRRSILRTARGG